MSSSLVAIFLVTELLGGTLSGTSIRGDSAGGGGAGLSSTTAPVSLYVGPAGDDTGNDCLSSAKPCKTIRGALDKVARLKRHPVTVQLLEGDVSAGGRIPPLWCDPADDSGCYLAIRGTRVTATLATGPSTVTLTTGSGVGYWQTWTVTGAGWTPGDLRGKLARVISTGALYSIHDNDATSFTLAGYVSPTVAAGSQVVIETWGSRITDGPVIPVSRPDQVAGTAKYGLYFLGTSGGPYNRIVTIDSVAFGPALAQGIRIEGDDMVNIYNCRFEGLSAIYVLGQAGGFITGNVHANTSSNVTFFAIGQAGGHGQRMMQVMGAVTLYGTGWARRGIDIRNGGYVISYANSWRNLSDIYTYDGALRFDTYNDRVEDCTGGWVLRAGGSGTIIMDNLSTTNTGCTVFGLYGGARLTVQTGFTATSSTANTTVFDIGSGAWARFPAGFTHSGFTYELKMDGLFRNLTELRQAPTTTGNPRTIQHPTGTTITE